MLIATAHPSPLLVWTCIAILYKKLDVLYRFIFWNLMWKLQHICPLLHFISCHDKNLLLFQLELRFKRQACAENSSESVTMLRSFHRSGALLNPLFGSLRCKTMSVEISLSWQQINILGSGGRAELTKSYCRGAPLRIIWYDMPFWSGLL